MAYYDALITQWPLLTPGTTAVKLAQLNAMTITGSVPATFPIDGTTLFATMVWSEFAALTAAQQQLVIAVCQLGNTRTLTGGSGTTLGNMFLAIFGVSSATITAFGQLAKAIVQPWWLSHGYLAPINSSDLIAAGNLT